MWTEEDLARIAEGLAWTAKTPPATAHQIITYRRPAPEGYQEVRKYRGLELIAPEAFPEERFRVDELLG